MKQIIKNIDKWTLLLPAMIVLVLLTVFSCKDEDEVSGDPYLTLYALEGTGAEVQIDDNFVLASKYTGVKDTNFVIRSNIGAWKIVPDKGYEDAVKIFPADGNNSGYMSFDITANPLSTPRIFNLNVVDASGRVWVSIKIQQEEAPFYLDVEFPEYAIDSKGGDFKVKITSNIAWIAYSTTGWISLPSFTADQEQVITTTSNPSKTADREGKVIFHALDGSLPDVTLKIVQFNEANDFEPAIHKTIEEVLESLNADGTGTITDNIYVEGFVISDRSKRALKNTQFVLEDESHKGIWFELLSPHTLNMNDKVKVHLYNARFIKSATAQGTTLGNKASGLSTAMLHDATPTEGIAPIELDELVDLEQYENVLVTLKRVEFPLPFGLYVNIDESNYHDLTKSKATADPYCDSTDEYGHLVRDAQGNTIKMYTSVDFIDRFKAVMPKGSGPLTGIIMKRTKNNQTNWILRIRNHEDNQVSTDEATGLSRVVMQLGPWNGGSGISVVSPATGNGIGDGTLRQSSRTSKNAAGSSEANNNQYMYMAYATMRKAATEVDGNGKPLVPYTNSLSYYGINSNNWWNMTSSWMSTSTAPGEAWIISTPSFIQTTTGGKLYLQFFNASSQSGPGPFVVEWTTGDEEDRSTVWKKVDGGEYVACSLDNTCHQMQYSFRLPDEMKGQPKVAIRLRVRENRRAQMNTTIADGGTNRFAAIRITQSLR